MARKSGLKPLWNKQQITKLFQEVAERADGIVLQMLNEAGEQFVTYARQQTPEDSFYDHTQNLRNSIGFVVVKNGQITKENFEQNGGGSEGVPTARQLCLELASEFSNGYVLIGVAGMQYAAYVEAIEGKDVISNAASFTEEHIKKVAQDLFKKLDI